MPRSHWTEGSISVVGPAMRTALAPFTSRFSLPRRNVEGQNAPSIGCKLASQQQLTTNAVAYSNQSTLMRPASRNEARRRHGDAAVSDMCVPNRVTSRPRQSSQTRKDGVTRSRRSILKRYARSARSGDDIEQQLEIQQQDGGGHDPGRDRGWASRRANSAVLVSQLIINCN